MGGGQAGREGQELLTQSTLLCETKLEIPAASQEKQQRSACRQQGGGKQPLCHSSSGGEAAPKQDREHCLLRALFQEYAIVSTPLPASQGFGSIAEHWMEFSRAGRERHWLHHTGKEGAQMEMSVPRNHQLWKRVQRSMHEGLESALGQLLLVLPAGPAGQGAETQPHGETWGQPLPPCPQQLQAGEGETGEEALSPRCLVPSRNTAYPQDAVPMVRQMPSPSPAPPRDNRPVPPSRAAAPHTLPTPTALAHSQALPRALHPLLLLWLQRDWSPRPPQLHIAMPTSIPHLCPDHLHLCSLSSLHVGIPAHTRTALCPSIQPHPIPATPSFYLRTCPSCRSWMQPCSPIRFIPIPSLRPPPFTSRPAPAAAGGCSPAATRRRGGSSRGGRGRCPWCCRRCPWCRRRSRTRTT